MLNILIVDDEPIIRNGLAETVRSLDLFDSVDTARNGLQALKSCEEKRYHVILLDIMMPEMDGIEFLERLKILEARYEQENEIPIQTLKIVLSGYDEFEYAQKTISLGVHEFLLKPLEPDDVILLAQRLYEKAATIEENMRRRRRLRDQINQSLPLLYEKFFNDLVGSQLTEEEILNKSRFLNLPLQGESYLVAVGTVMPTAGSSEMVGNLALKSFLAAMETASIPGFQWHFFEIGLSRCAIIFYFNEEPDGDLKIEAFLSRLIEGIYESEGFHIKCGMGTVVSRLDLIKKSYREACKALMYATLLTDSTVQKLSDEEDSTGQALMIEDLSELSSYLKLGDMKKAERFLTYTFQQIQRQQSPQVAADIRLMFTGILYTCFSAMRQKDVQLNEDKTHNYFKVMEDNRLYTIAEYKNIIYNLLRDTITCINNESSNRKLSVVEKAKRIAKEEGYSNLTTHMVAEILGLSRNYFGQLFKKETGYTFTDYLNRKRVEKAKKLLETTTLKIYEISEQVGIDDSYYFSSLFKKYVGCSPTEYREA
ncbi:MAG: response regulator [Clostridiales bacterium]|nr:response regulator [Clostridiales bacterium]